MHTAVVIGHVDHGKSTLLGRLLADTGNLKKDKLAAVQRTCDERGIALEPAYFLDALAEEQAQGISIDGACVELLYGGERLQLIDAPGHRDFIKNMASAASHADYGLLVIDAEEGVRAQTELHLKILKLLAVQAVVVAINKMDRVHYSYDVFAAIASRASALIKNEEIECAAVIPVCALQGENLVQTSNAMPWYHGRSLLEELYGIGLNSHNSRRSHAEPFRMILQDVYKFDDKRYFAGRVVCGAIEPGTDVFFSPSGKIARIESIDAFPQGPLKEAAAGASITLRLAEQIFVERGEVVSQPGQTPLVDTTISGRIVWLSQQSIDPGSTYLLKLGTQHVACRVEVISTSVMGIRSAVDGRPSMGEFADIRLTTERPVAFDLTPASSGLNRFVICSEFETLAAGIVAAAPAQAAKAPARSVELQSEVSLVTRQQREARQNHRGGVIWLTGLSAAGKSSLAKAAEKRLFADGFNITVVDADNVRQGLCADLTFTPQDRMENVRRLAEVANVLKEQGSLCIVAAISPYQSHRQLARHIIGERDFAEVFVFCPLEECQRRDPKNLYRQVSAGELKSFAGIDMPYQPPSGPDLRLDTSVLTVEQEVELLVDYIQQNFSEVHR